MERNRWTNLFKCQIPLTDDIPFGKREFIYKKNIEFALSRDRPDLICAHHRYPMYDFIHYERDDIRTRWPEAHKCAKLLIDEFITACNSKQMRYGINSHVLYYSVFPDIPEEARKQVLDKATRIKNSFGYSFSEYCILDYFPLSMVIRELPNIVVSDNLVIEVAAMAELTGNNEPLELLFKEREIIDKAVDLKILIKNNFDYLTYRSCNGTCVISRAIKYFMNNMDIIIPRNVMYKMLRWNSDRNIDNAFKELFGVPYEKKERFILNQYMAIEHK